MIAVDTNLLVRLLTYDDPGQARRAAKIMESDTIFIPKTVLLETEWVLRHAYGIGKTKIIEAFQRLLGLKNVSVEDPEIMQQAVVWYESDLDFADALHLASSKGAEKFATFDTALVKKARHISAVQVIKP
jgi:predicted nucleic-acid-binding protein